MKTSKTLVIAIATGLIAACSSTKKTIAPLVPVAPKPVATAKPADGIYAPGDEELAAIQSQFSDATLAQLKQGYAVYTQDACTGCHGAKNIYKRATASWKGIIDDMAQRARLTAVQKDAVYRYVMAIKATQPSGAKSEYRGY